MFLSKEQLPATTWRWPVGLLGLASFVFAIVALSGPGRIDIVDGQTRFEVGRSLVEHGDSALRDPRIWWSSFPGRDGLNFSYYRFPHSVAAAGAIVVADGTGPISEGRRHFVFVAIGAVSAAVLALFYAIGVRRLGCSTGRSLLWALGGIVCTPSWFYATSTYDEIIGTTVIVAAAIIAGLSRSRHCWLGAVGVGLLLGVAFNVKQTLAAFLLVCLALHDDPRASTRVRLIRAAIICLGLAVGVVVQDMYDSVKFPFDKRTVHAELMKLYAPDFTSQPWPAFACFMLSPGCGIVWYCPTIILSLCGLYQTWKRGNTRLVAAVCLMTAAFIGFHCFISYFSGDPAWGPRYLTPWFGLMWLFVPLGAVMLSRLLVGVLLGFGVLVQLLALSVDPHRLFVANGLSSTVGIVEPWLYFEPGFSHVLQRPREIREILQVRGTAEAYTPSPSPTFAFPVIDLPYLPETGQVVVDRYQVLRSFRPWWSSQRFLPPEQRPVDFERTLLLLGSMSVGGLALMRVGVRSEYRKVANGKPPVSFVK